MLAPSTKQQLQGHLLAPEPSSCDCMSSWLKKFSASKSFLSQIPPPKKLEVLQDGALVSSSWGPQLPSAKNQPIPAFNPLAPRQLQQIHRPEAVQLHRFRMLQGWLRGPQKKFGSHTHPRLNVQRPGIYIVGSSASGRKFAWDNVMSSSPGSLVTCNHLPPPANLPCGAQQGSCQVLICPWKVFPVTEVVRSVEGKRI